MLEQIMIIEMEIGNKRCYHKLIIIMCQMRSRLDIIFLDTVERRKEL